MSTTTITILMLATILPGVVLMVMIYNQDKIEKEPGKLLAKLFIFGALTTISAMILEIIGSLILNLVFYPETTIYNALECFIVVACSEEGGKYFVNKKVAWKNPAFDYRFDGVVYGVFTGLGFAVLENILYVFQYGLGNALVRALTAVPGHCMFGIFMGMYLGHAKACSNYGDENGCKSNLRKAFWVPVFIHGFYDFCLQESTYLSVIVFYIFLIALYVIAFKTVRTASKNDRAIVPPVPEVPDFPVDPGDPNGPTI